jgi:hypothetical protein
VIPQQGLDRAVDREGAGMRLLHPGVGVRIVVGIHLLLLRCKVHKAAHAGQRRYRARLDMTFFMKFQKDESA